MYTSAAGWAPYPDRRVASFGPDGIQGQEQRRQQEGAPPSMEARSVHYR